MIRVKGWFVLFMITFSLLGSTACGGNGDGNTEKNTGDGYLLTYEQITAEKAKEIMDSEEACVIIDARTDAEFAAGHIPQAVNIDVRGEKFDSEAKALLDPSRPVAVYCRSGARSKTAARNLVDKGYRVYELNNGFMNWNGARTKPEE